MTDLRKVLPGNMKLYCKKLGLSQAKLADNNILTLRLVEEKEL